MLLEVQTLAQLSQERCMPRLCRVPCLLVRQMAANPFVETRASGVHARVVFSPSPLQKNR